MPSDTTVSLGRALDMARYHMDRIRTMRLSSREGESLLEFQQNELLERLTEAVEALAADHLPGGRIDLIDAEVADLEDRVDAIKVRLPVEIER